jgi:hypothetical protein
MNSLMELPPNIFFQGLSQNDFVEEKGVNYKSFDIPPNIIKEGEEANWDEAINNMLLGGEVLRLARFKGLLKEFDEKFLGNEGNWLTTRSLMVGDCAEEKDSIGMSKMRNVKGFNSINLTWQGLSDQGTKQFRRMGFGVVDGQLLGFYLLALAGEEINDTTVREYIESREAKHIYIRTPYVGKNSRELPIIQNGAIVFSRLFDEVSRWGYNSIASDMNCIITENRFREVIPHSPIATPKLLPFVPMENELQYAA